ncbi:Protein UXT [Schistosoma japonicum]|uniref:Protein UXT n=1 Tax=Schistosoma japonicum TaxID=6182 RepID=A0A4Z2D4R4_SCHJA|nr:Protein UXT [Schistosoma japonicum]KAH8872138.1 Protein UXT [Schistosoma japonicum]TNN11472.1 Protein UXT [Schistosoma japonicum]
MDEKILKIEEHVNETLRKDLKKTLDAGDLVYGQISEYLELKNLLEKMKDIDVAKSNLKTKVNVGSNIYVNGLIYFIEPISIDIGLGFYLECSHTEALDIINSRISILTERADMYKKRANSIKARIKLFLEGLRNLQNLK